jgi:hypothetical protein
MENNQIQKMVKIHFCFDSLYPYGFVITMYLKELKMFEISNENYEIKMVL